MVVKYYTISVIYFKEVFNMEQTLVLSNYRSSKVTLIVIFIKYDDERNL